MVLFAENHGYWQKIVDPFSGSQKGKYFIHLCPVEPPIQLGLQTIEVNILVKWSRQLIPGHWIIMVNHEFQGKLSGNLYS